MARYSDNFRRDTVEFVKSRGLTIESASVMLGIPEPIISFWLAENSADAFISTDSDLMILQALLRSLSADINTLKRLELDDLASQVTTDMYRSIERLSSLVNQMSTAGNQSNEWDSWADRPFYLGDVLETSAELLAEYTANQQVQLIISPAPKNANFLKGDRGRVTHLIYSLLENAIERSPRCQVKLDVNERANNGELVRLAFALKDTGLLYSSDSRYNTRDLTHITHRSLRRSLNSFSTLLNATHAEFSWWVEGGEVNVLEVTMTLPLHRADLRPLIELSKLRVFAVDPNREHLSALDATLTSLGLTPILFETAKQYFEYLSLHPELNRPQSVLMIAASVIHNEVMQSLTSTEFEHRVSTIMMGMGRMASDYPKKIFHGQLSLPITPPKLLKCLSERANAKR